MFITVHATAATLIGKFIPHPALAFLAGLASHFLLDIPPHGDTRLGQKFFGIQLKNPQHKEDIRPLALLGTLDAFCLSMLVLYLFRNFDFVNSDSVAWAIVGSILPDVNMVVYRLTKFKVLAPLEKLHQKNHYLLLNRIGHDLPFAYGLLMQIVVLSGLLFLIYTF